jgi:hypothetical protein
MAEDCQRPQFNQPEVVEVTYLLRHTSPISWGEGPRGGERSDFICLMKNDLNGSVNLETPHPTGAKENRIRHYFS